MARHRPPAGVGAGARGLARSPRSPSSASSTGGVQVGGRRGQSKEGPKVAEDREGAQSGDNQRRPHIPKLRLLLWCPDGIGRKLRDTRPGGKEVSSSQRGPTAFILNCPVQILTVWVPSVSVSDFGCVREHECVREWCVYEFESVCGCECKREYAGCVDKCEWL